jgi:hypothetical protein
MNEPAPDWNEIDRQIAENKAKTTESASNCKPAPTPARGRPCPANPATNSNTAAEKTLHGSPKGSPNRLNHPQYRPKTQEPHHNCPPGA